MTNLATGIKSGNSAAGKPLGGQWLWPDAIGSLRRPEFWTFSAWLDIISRYRRSRLGVLWLFVPPATTVLVIGNFYAGFSGRDPRSFMPYMGMGYLIWRFITQVIGETASVMLSHRPFIMDGRTRFTDYIFRALSKAAIYAFAAFAMVSIAFLFSPMASIQGFLTLFLTVPLLVVNVVALGVVVSLLGARYPDIQELTTTLFLFGFLLTPILWDPALVPKESIRATLMYVNPAFHLVQMIRSPFLGGSVESITWIYVGVMTTVMLVLSTALYRRYARFIPIWI